jgi:hypothetical protein
MTGYAKPKSRCNIYFYSHYSGLTDIDASQSEFIKWTSIAVVMRRLHAE